MAWFNTGFSGKEDKSTHQKQAKTPGGPIKRFWCGVGKTTSIIFLDDFTWCMTPGENIPRVVPFCFYEHQINVDDDYQNAHFFTCVGDGCPLCEAKYIRKQVSVLSVINVWKNDKGKEYGQKQLFVMNSKTAALIEGKMMRKNGNLKGLRYSVSRTDRKSAKVGNDFEFESNVGDKVHELFPGIDLDPYGFTEEKAMEYYLKMFEPKSVAEIKKFLSTYKCSDGYVFLEKPSTPADAPKTEEQPDIEY